MFPGAGLAARRLAPLLLCVCLASLGHGQTTAPPPIPCSSYRTCDSCVPHAQCLWCFSSGNCTDYPVSWLLPPASLCPLSQARWGVCWLNFEALIIVLAVLCGTIIISITVCCCCCCCCKRSSPRPDRDEENLARRREEIRQRSEERKVERKARHDEIRRKYGLIGDADHPYSKFENE
ncbi:pituitary tumor-transforming gene 1 protein-interacting protein [Salarias fasciatus]|uniref:Pituitary tumor-transforming gene 1 protein-interacting protein-like n=1 Tax=Salarias fasciatus TaxID=181472 RepID=A0A672G2R4_SALFA|nr:pituitary tumor-transforming gene 1 protein-interacting protein-like [Salarias fasciatus]